MCRFHKKFFGKCTCAGVFASITCITQETIGTLRLVKLDGQGNC